MTMQHIVQENFLMIWAYISVKYPSNCGYGKAADFDDNHTVGALHGTTWPVDKAPVYNATENDVEANSSQGNLHALGRFHVETKALDLSSHPLGVYLWCVFFSILGFHLHSAVVVSNRRAV
ncbi:hypothetical protein T265_02146 [Opisthorchis viverrini]|uniref:Uncharacterized protein n=1 Tax=Opisthorchis viverrini TaxID=6198 RepID=A0A074ZX02_OPIVI|nr:hypothetical protein T265_02146 [Opisthorchis viverrini]KER31636.1 hypothetical protein T265_02146 [Opisthorchis viverrini]